MPMNPGVALVGGLDPTGGAGLAADILAVHHTGVSAYPVITANTIQGPGITTQFRVTDPDFFHQQLSTLFKTHSPSAVKTGMLGSSDILTALLDCLKQLNQIPDVVMDPVMAASSGGTLIGSDMRSSILNCGHRIDLLTPNQPELHWLTGIELSEQDDFQDSIGYLRDYGFENVLVKGGHSTGVPVDTLFVRGHCVWQKEGLRYKKTVRGSGCRLASSIAAGLAMGRDLIPAVDCAYAYVQELFRQANSKL